MCHLAGMSVHSRLFAQGRTGLRWPLAFELDACGHSRSAICTMIEWLPGFMSCLTAVRYTAMVRPACGAVYLLLNGYSEMRGRCWTVARMQHACTLGFCHSSGVVTVTS